MENERLNEIRELNPDFEISCHGRAWTSNTRI